MLNLVFFSFFYSNVIYIILGLSALAIFILFFKNLKNQDKEDNEFNYFQNYKHQNLGNDINLKMQAYERLTILLERTDSFKILGMIDKKEKNIEKIELSILQTIFSEFEYNISQQVYVSDTLWNLIIASKNKNINLISSVKRSLKKNASGSDFFNALSLVLENQETTPSKIALSYLKKEVRSIL